MTCVICKHGQTEDQLSSIAFEVGSTTIVFKQVPAKVCSTCGEVYVDSSVSRQLLQEAAKAAQDGVQVEVRAFAA